MGKQSWCVPIIYYQKIYTKYRRQQKQGYADHSSSKSCWKHVNKRLKESSQYNQGTYPLE